MESIIRKGVSIIQMPPQEKKVNKKTGVLGTYISGGKYKAEICYKSIKYHLGTYDSLEDAKKMREIADREKEEGIFPEWYAATFPPKENQYGVAGLAYQKERKLYQLMIGYKNKRYSVGCFKTVEDAVPVRAEADKHIADGTFLEWYVEYKQKKQSNE